MLEIGMEYWSCWLGEEELFYNQVDTREEIQELQKIQEIQEIHMKV